MNIKIIASGSTGNCYIIDDSKTKIMIECGIPIRNIREKGGFTVHENHACLISHEH